MRWVCREEVKKSWTFKSQKFDRCQVNVFIFELGNRGEVRVANIWSLQHLDDNKSQWGGGMKSPRKRKLRSGIFQRLEMDSGGGPSK